MFDNDIEHGITYSNRTVASARNFLSKSQRKKTSRLKTGDTEVSVRTAEVKGHSATDSYSERFLLPAESERRQQQNHEDQEGVTFMHRCPVFSRPADTQRRPNQGQIPPSATADLIWTRDD